MATIKSLNQYKANYEDMTELSVAAESMVDALEALGESKPDVEPSILTKTAKGVVVAIPAPAISVITEVQSEAAVSGGCKATPYNIANVENGNKVWFTAIPADGFQFAGWFLNGEKVSEEESYEATIEYAGSTPTTLKYIAQFSAI